jgi:hypothetical protein
MPGDIVDSVQLGDVRVEIDNWGGVHYHIPDDHDGDVLSLDPTFVQRIENKRQEALKTMEAADPEYQS